MGRFHGYDLAKELHRHGHLLRLFTPYPKFAARPFSIPDSSVTSLLSIGAAIRVWGMRPARLYRSSDDFLHEMFDRSVARLLPKETDIFVGWSTSCGESLRRAKALGSLTVVDEGSSHILFQEEILKEEFSKYGLKARLPSPRIIQKAIGEYEQADAVAVGSTFAAKSFGRYGVPEKKIKIIPYGVDLTEFKKVKKEDPTFRLIFVGTLALHKGVHYLLQAFHELNLPKSELWLIGPLGNEMIPFLKKYKDDKIVRLGPFTQSDLYRYYSQGSVFCLPSLTEGMGMVLLQAMACGLPVISTVNTGGPDLVENGKEGFVMPIRDVDRLKEKILYFYENPSAVQAMGEAARKRAEDFTWERYGDRAAAVYRALISTRTGSLPT